MQLQFWLWTVTNFSIIVIARFCDILVFVVGYWFVPSLSSQLFSSLSQFTFIYLLFCFRGLLSHFIRNKLRILFADFGSENAGQRSSSASARHLCVTGESVICREDANIGCGWHQWPFQENTATAAEADWGLCISLSFLLKYLIRSSFHLCAMLTVIVTGNLPENVGEFVSFGNRLIS